MKKVRKIVSVILCAVISCMCLVSPVSADNQVGKANIEIISNLGTDIASQAATRTFGITRIYAIPAIYDESVGDITKAYTEYMSYTQYFSGGADFANIYVSLNSQAKYTEYNCNAWVIQIDYLYDPNVRKIELAVDGQFVYSKSNDSQHYMAFYTVRDIPYSKTIPYSLIATYNDGGTLWAGGHIGCAQIA